MRDAISTILVGFAVSCGVAHEPVASKPTAIWVHRRLVVGRGRAESSLDELRLAIDADGRATLVVTERRAAQGGFAVPPGELSFREVRHKILHGTATSSRDGLDVALADESGATRMRCAYEKKRVARANAIRVRDPSFTSECGDRGIWSPAEPVEVDALVCTNASAAVGADEQPTTFGRAPGIELLGVSEGCFLQGEAERLVPEDGALAPALAR